MTDLLTTLRAADPARHDAPAPPDAARMDAVVHELLRTEPRPAGPRPTRTPRTPRRRAPLALAATGLAAAAFAAVLAAPRDSSVAPAPASAAVVLGQLAQADAATPAAGEGRYAYRRTIRYTTHMRGTDAPYAVVLPHIEEEWLDEQGDGVMRQRIDESAPQFPTPADREAYEEAKLPPLDFPGADGYQVRAIKIAGLSAAQIRALPTDSVPALREAVLAGMRDSGVKADNAVLAGVSQLLGSPLTPEPVRTALYATLKVEPGAEVSRDVRDPLGRGGIAITFRSEAWTTTLLFDEATGALLASRSIGAKELPGRTITDWSVVEETGRRAAAPDAPTQAEIRARMPKVQALPTPPQTERR